MGTPTQMFDREGTNVWDAELDIYGKVRTFKGSSLKDCPFRYQGQYLDSKTGLYYNRFRYYDPETGSYISQDPIGILGGNRFYSYVQNINKSLDPLGRSSFDPFEFGTITDFPDDIMFGQTRCAPQFSEIGSQAPDSIRGKSLEDVAEGLRKGNISPDDFIISYTKTPKGEIVTLNNRGFSYVNNGK